MKVACLKDFFEAINQRCSYLVLRNWDNLFDDSIYGSGHEDIDILCDDLNTFISCTDATRIHSEQDRDNFIIKIGDKAVRFDIRWVGDGYYPDEWERKMLCHRVLNEQGVFVMCAEDYFFSLAYHALIQKPTLSAEYLKKLNDVYSLIYNNDIILDKNNLMELLSDFLKRNCYSVVLSSDPGVFFNKNNTRYMPLYLNKSRQFKRICFQIKQKFQYYINRIWGKLS